ncbi:MAG: hypothetical protein KVP17_003960 [Porospora cf. gigantea B]|nr:MAG: hypothetical protein KVP17_003960 [Porospora cf. gigantea B]
MGKRNRHSKDKLYLIPTEFASDWGGYKAGRKRAPFRSLPFYCCGLSLLPFSQHPVCLRNGIVFEAENIIPYIKQCGKNPIDGSPLEISDLIPLTFHKNADGEFHCPVTFKVFTNHTHIVANAQSGMVYCDDAIQTLCRRPNNWRDLMTNEPFRPSDLIDIQNPLHVESRDLANFEFIKNDDLGKLSIFEQSQPLPQRPPPPLLNDESRPRINETRLIRKIHAAERTLQKEHTALFPPPAERPKGPLSQLYTTAAHASSVTSTWVDRSQEQYREMTDAEIRKDLYRSIKGSGKKGFVRLVTNLGPLNLELYCDQTPQTCHNFLLHCKSGYYKDTIFHRCIPNFMVQGGDPEGTGRGGVPAFSGVETFGDEFRAKLRHTGRGVLSMANSGPNTNKSQFFLTFASAEHLNDKHTIFGRLVGGKETLAALEALRTNQEGRPKAPPRIVEVIIYSDPFDASGDEDRPKRRKLELDL